MLTLPGISIIAAPKYDLVEAGGYTAISTEKANLGGGTTEKHFLNNYRTSLIRQDGRVEKIKIYIESKPSAIKAFFFEVWRKQGEGWNRISQENIWPRMKGGQVSEIILSSKPLAQEGDYIGYGYICKSDPGLFLTSSTDPDLYDPNGAYNNKSYSISDAGYTAKNYLWATQTASLQFVPIKVYMKHPRIVFIGDSIISGAPNHLSFADTYFPGAYPGRAAVGIDPSTTIGYKVGKALKCSYQNMGAAGAVSSYILKRFNTDCVQLKPTLAVISVGINDLSVSVTKDEFLANYTVMLELCKTSGIQPVVNLILPRTDFSDAKAREMDDWNLSLQTLAGKYNAVVVDARSAVSESRIGGDPGNLWNLRQEYAADIVHYNPTGNVKIAQVITDVLKIECSTELKDR
jgi:lysophospholipase L1-like esterase